MKAERKQIRDAVGHVRNTTLYDIEIDSQSEEELKTLLPWTKSMLGNLRSQCGEYSKKDRSRDVFDACVKIYNTDISHLYGEQSTEEKYYVYCHCDPSRNIAIHKHGVSTFAATLGLKYLPFYVGMGQGNRAFDFDRNETHRKYRQKIQALGLDVSPVIIKDGLSRSEALSLESKLIDIFGLIVNNGFLVNLDEGKNNKDRRNLYSEELIKISRINTMFIQNSLSHHR